MKKIHPANDLIKTVAFVAARLNSSRLPGKQFMHIGEKSIIEWIIKSLQLCHELDEIVIATVAASENEPLRQFAQKNNLSCFWYEGEVDHLTTRLRKAAETFQADICVLISCDCPLIYAPAIDYLIRELKQNADADYVSVKSDKPGLTSALEGVFVAYTKTWQLADALSDKPELKEHMFPVIFKRPDLFTKKDCIIPMDIYDPPHRFSVDTWADLEFMNKLQQELKAKDISFELPNILNLIRNKPRLLKINEHVHQRALLEDIKKVLFIVDAGSDFGYGHLMRCLEIALQITERMSWPVTFLVDDEKAAEIIEKRGIRTIWGAFGRDQKTSATKREPVLFHRIIDQYSLVVLDIYWKLHLKTGWRNSLHPDATVIVLNRTEPWALVGDKIIIPEVYAEEKPIENLSGGLKFAVIRREIRAAKDADHEKNIDILAYLHLPEHQALVKDFAKTRKLSIVLIDRFREDFPKLLACSRFFISGFGYSFYEALFVGTIPVTLPLSKAHEDAALFFYKKIKMSPLIINKNFFQKQDWSQTDLINTIAPIEDGTKHVVDEIAEAVRRIEPMP